MQLPQSTVSRHLKALADAGWVAARAEGTSNVYTMTRDELDAVRAPAVAAGARAGRADARRGAGSAARCRPRWPSAAPSRRSSSRRRPASGIGCATSCSAIAFIWRRSPALADGDVDRRRSRLRHRPGERRARAVRRARDRRRRLGGDAAGGQEAAAAARQRRAAPRRARGAADRRRAARRRDADAGAAPRAGAGSARSPKWRACSSRAAASLVVDMLPHDRESYRQQMGHVWLGFSDDHMRAHARRGRVRRRSHRAAAAGPERQRDRGCSSQRRRRRQQSPRTGVTTAA